MGVSGCITTFCFVSSFSNMLSTIPSTPASSALTLVSHQSHNACTTNGHLCDNGERNGTQRRTKVNFGRTIMQELHGAAVVGKTHIYSEATLNTEEIKPVALAIIVLCLSEVSQSVSQCKIRFLNKIISTL